MPQYDESFLHPVKFQRRVRSYCLLKQQSVHKSRSLFRLSAVPLLLSITSHNRFFKTPASICSTAEEEMQISLKWKMAKVILNC
uniref:Uncharacterized protein n=1 Tax=Trichogramma kaykai TaxID=54128 RepID=A0ABD2WW71_9HYME